MNCKLFSILAIFLVEELFPGPKIIGLVLVGAIEGKDAKNGLQSILSSSPGIQIRAGRPLADVIENLHWHDEAIPLSVEEDEAVIVDDEVPEFTMGPFLENAFSMDPTNMTEKKTNSSPLNSAQIIQRRLPIHETDLANAIFGMPTQKTIININSPGKMLSANISETNLKQNSTKENIKFGQKREQEGNKNKTTANNSAQSIHPILPQANNGNGHCSWQILNIFLLNGSISQKMRRMAARKAVSENKLQKSGQMMLNGNGQNLMEIIQPYNKEKDESTKMGKHLMYY